MHKIGRWILLALFVAFLAGLMPTIFEWCDRFFVFTEEGLGVTRHFTHTVDSVFLTLKDYAWHITIIYAAVIAFVIFMEGQNPDRTILWMLALIFLPVFGVVLYLVIGPDFRSLRKRTSAACASGGSSARPRDTASTTRLSRRTWRSSFSSGACCTHAAARSC